MYNDNVIDNTYIRYSSLAINVAITATCMAMYCSLLFSYFLTVTFDIQFAIYRYCPCEWANETQLSRDLRIRFEFSRQFNVALRYDATRRGAPIRHAGGLVRQPGRRTPPAAPKRKRFQAPDPSAASHERSSALRARQKRRRSHAEKTCPPGCGRGHTRFRAVATDRRFRFRPRRYLSFGGFRL